MTTVEPSPAPVEGFLAPKEQFLSAPDGFADKVRRLGQVPLNGSLGQEAYQAFIAGSAMYDLPTDTEGKEFANYTSPAYSSPAARVQTFVHATHKILDALDKQPRPLDLNKMTGVRTQDEAKDQVRELIESLRGDIKQHFAVEHEAAVRALNEDQRGRYT